jgi:signal transduction histidine kinase
MLPIQFMEAGDVQNLERNRELMIFRIVQELVNNALKHAQASSITVTFNATEHLLVAVEDDGVGFNAEEHKNDKRSGKGLGLFNIENRARLLGGKIEFDKEREKRSRIALIVPYEKV